MEETWRDVVGYEGLYIVSSYGKVVSTPKLLRTPSTTFMSKPREISQSESKGGYLRVGLTKDGAQKHLFVHRIVAEAFIGIRRDMTVNHKDENKRNNHADNLEYMSRADNVRYGTGATRSAQRRKELSVGGVPVNQYTIDGRFVRRYKSGVNAMEVNGWKGSGADIFLCCDRKHHTAYGYIWRRDGDTDTSFVVKKYTKKIIQMSLNGDFIAEYESIREASDKCGAQRGHICSCCKGKRTKAGGYTWKYKD